MLILSIRIYLLIYFIIELFPFRLKKYIFLLLSLLMPFLDELEVKFSSIIELEPAMFKYGAFDSCWTFDRFFLLEEFKSKPTFELVLFALLLKMFSWCLPNSSDLFKDFILFTLASLFDMLPAPDCLRLFARVYRTVVHLVCVDIVCDYDVVLARVYVETIQLPSI